MKKVILVFAALLMLCVSCDVGPQRPARRHRRPLLVPSSSGNPYEVMVVAEDSLWEGYSGRALKTALSKPLPMLPQREEVFHVSHVTERHYDRITNLFRNIIVLKINPYYVEPKVKIERDVHSSPQLIMTIEGPSDRMLSPFITEQTRFLIRYFTAEEINREATRLEDEHNIKFNQKVQEMFGCEFYIPADIRKMKVGKDFIWASDDGLSSIQNICIYSYPYFTERVFSGRNVYMALRDSFMRANIPGEHPGSVMATNHEFCDVVDMDIQGHYVQEARGLWEMTGEAMGGPFVAHSQVDTVNGRVIVVEGFVYAPDKMKRTMLRRLEAALYTLRLP
jgi:hypothetical protein